MKKQFVMESGKYVVVRDDDDYSIKIFRNEERWYTMEEEMKYMKFFHSMLNKIDDLGGAVDVY